MQSPEKPPLYPTPETDLSQLEKEAQNDPQALKKLGQLYLKQKNYPQAEVCFKKVLAHESETLPLLNVLGFLAYQQKDFQAAETYFLKTCQLEPQNPGHYFNLCAAYLQMQTPEKAAQILYRLIEAQPQEFQQFYQTLQQVLRTLPQLPMAIYHDFMEALLDYPVFRQKQLFIDLALSYRHNAEPDKALATFQALYQILPELWIKLCTLFVIPIIFESSESILTWRAQFEANIRDFMTELTPEKCHALAKNPGIMPSPTFYLAYQGLNDLPLNQLIGQLFSQIFQEAIQKYQFKPYQGLRSKLRIGFISAYFYNHSVTHCYFHLIEAACHQDDFEVYCFSLGDYKPDAWTARYQSLCHEFISMPSNDFEKTRDIILARQLDILVYTDIGMDPTTYLLALHRLAHRQYVLGGHPVTTGLPEMDYYISGQQSPSEVNSGASQEYSEIPLGMSVAMYSDLHKIELAEPLKSKQELGLPESGNLYFCPMTLFKVHPDFDLILQGILEGDPQAQILFCKYGNTRLHEKLQARFKKHLGPLSERIHFLNWLPKGDFLQVLDRVEVVLDTIHFSGGNTSRICFLLGQPIVTMPSPFVRGSVTARQYYKLGLESEIALSIPDYINKALKLALDPLYRKKIQAQIKTKNHCLLKSHYDPQALFQHFRKSSQDESN